MMEYFSIGDALWKRYHVTALPLLKLNCDAVVGAFAYVTNQSWSSHLCTNTQVKRCLFCHGSVFTVVLMSPDKQTLLILWQFCFNPIETFSATFPILINWDDPDVALWAAANYASPLHTISGDPSQKAFCSFLHISSKMGGVHFHSHSAFDPWASRLSLHVDS